MAWMEAVLRWSVSLHLRLTLTCTVDCIWVRSHHRSASPLFYMLFITLHNLNSFTSRGFRWRRAADLLEYCPNQATEQGISRVRVDRLVWKLSSIIQSLFCNVLIPSSALGDSPLGLALMSSCPPPVAYLSVFLSGVTNLCLSLNYNTVWTPCTRHTATLTFAGSVNMYPSKWNTRGRTRRRCHSGSRRTAGHGVGRRAPLSGRATRRSRRSFTEQCTPARPPPRPEWHCGGRRWGSLPHIR